MRRSTFVSGREVAVCLVVVLGGVAPSVARAQACCASPSLATPLRLARDERAGLGLQARGRGAFGVFSDGGAFATTPDGEVETAQELFVAVRVLERAQLALVVPFVETRRRAGALVGWGGGLGDVRAGAHVELLRAGARPYVPGVALLASASLPTGRPPEDARDALAADATGTGSFDASAGFELDQRWERVFATLAGTVGRRAALEVAGVRETFAPRLSALASGGVTLANEVSLGLFAAYHRQAAAHDGATGGAVVGSALSLATLGLGASVPIDAEWRAQASTSVDVPLAGLGRNELAGVGLGVSIVRLWP